MKKRSKSSNALSQRAAGGGIAVWMELAEWTFEGRPEPELLSTKYGLTDFRYRYHVRRICWYTKSGLFSQFEWHRGLSEFVSSSQVYCRLGTFFILETRKVSGSRPTLKIKKTLCGGKYYEKINQIPVTGYFHRCSNSWMLWQSDSRNNEHCRDHCSKLLQQTTAAGAADTTAAESSGEAKAENGASYTIGIGQFAAHGSLDNCREGFLTGTCRGRHRRRTEFNRSL